MKKEDFRNANMNGDVVCFMVMDPSRRLAVGDRWRLAVDGGWRRLVLGGWWRLALAAGGSWSLRAVLKGCNWQKKTNLAF